MGLIGGHGLQVGTEEGAKRHNDAAKSVIFHGLW
jgi:hypothetical protein